ncbi:sepiapterin reductase isoform X2 [Temnothorax nylanderi]|uniref:sepiapterin reductase isoform X2 n=1 Tax=Temnothorax nylanderi TaxID=102681 RepID=UPI003A837D63
MSVEALSGKVFLLVTGASRGIGRQIAITFGSLLEEGSRVLLLARNKDALRKVASNIPSKVEVYTASTDLSKSTDVEFQGIGSGQYSSVKAAREMYFKVFALENPDANVLSYSPGPVDTDMFTTVCETIADPEAKKMYIEMRQKKTVLTTEQTVNRLVQILKERKYNAADHVDYYDNL